MSTIRWLVGAVVATVVGALLWTPTTLAAAPQVLDDRLSSSPGIARPWQPGRPQLGINIYWTDDPRDSDEIVRLKARRALDYVIGLEANAVTVSFPIYVDSSTSSQVRTDERTPSPPRLALLLEEAERSGLRTSIRPLLDEANLQKLDSRWWRGLLDPDDRAAWFSSYQGLLTPYLELADRLSVETVVVAAELNALQDDGRWAELVNVARQLYHGELGYSANWDAYESAGDIPVDTISIDAYPQLRLPSTATEEEMRQAWLAWLDRTAPRGGPQLTLSEVGAAAESRTLDNPAVHHTEGTRLNEGIQRRWFAAACRAAQERQVGGLYWWKIQFDVDPALVSPLYDLHDSFLGRQAETAVRQCFETWAPS